MSERDPHMTTGSEELARSKVVAPAVALMVGSVLAFLSYLAASLFVLFGDGKAWILPSTNDAPVTLFGWIVLGGVLSNGGAPNVVGLTLATLTFVGAFRMVQLKSHGLAMFGAILATIPCTSYVFCICMMPIGIWALVVLWQPEVRSAFR
jgi:hypothetical protein